jgi:hypothetical protein
MNDTVPTRKLPRGRFLISLVLSAMAGFGACWLLCSYRGVSPLGPAYQPIEEAKLCYAALTRHAEMLHPQTREYLKARYYSNAATWISPDWLHGMAADFGPVDDAALGGLKAIKDGGPTAEVYRAALAKHGITPGSR